MKAARVPYWGVVSPVSQIILGIPNQRLVLRGGKDYGVWGEDEPMCDQHITSRLIELEVMVSAYFLRPLVPLISFEAPQALGSAAQLFPFSACSLTDKK